MLSGEKRIREMLPPLPSGVMPSYIHYLDVIDMMEKEGISCKNFGYQ